MERGPFSPSYFFIVWAHVFLFYPINILLSSSFCCLAREAPSVWLSCPFDIFPSCFKNSLSYRITRSSLISHLPCISYFFPLILPSLHPPGTSLSGTLLEEVDKEKSKTNRTWSPFSTLRHPESPEAQPLLLPLPCPVANSGAFQSPECYQQRCHVSFRASQPRLQWITPSLWVQPSPLSPSSNGLW